MDRKYIRAKRISSGVPVFMVCISSVLSEVGILLFLMMATISFLCSAEMLLFSIASTMSFFVISLDFCQGGKNVSCSTPRRVKLEDDGPAGRSISCVHIGVCFGSKDMVPVAEDK